jgi:peptide/nickel transport system ATP-binding protein
VTILEDIDLELKRGQAIGVIGESGSGKTTLARAAAGLLPPSTGTMEFDGRALPPALQARSREDLRRIQIVFQSADTALNPSRTIEAILARPLQFYRGLKGEALRRRIDELLDLVKLPRTLAERLPGGLSGGQKQRVNLARALAAEPDLILCDGDLGSTPWSAPRAGPDCRVAARTRCVLFISHDLHTVRAVCDEIVVMRHGRNWQVARADYERGPHHPYYEELARAVPELRRGWLTNDWARPALVA